VNSILRTDAEVALALARRALPEKQFDLAEKYGAIAKDARKWSQPYLLTGQIAMGRALFGDFSSGGNSRECIESAEASCSAALAIAQEEKDRYAIMACLILRADIRLMLGRTEEALTDAKQAELIDAEDVGVLLGLAQALATLDRHDEAIEIFRKAHRLHQRPGVAFLLSRTLRARAGSGDSDEALEVLRQVKLSETPFDLRTTYVMEKIQLFVRKRDWARARRYLQSIADLLRPETLLVFEGSVSHYESDQERAAELAQRRQAA
jgi:tetratricopeptide (TPR) repeat protein